MVDQTDATSCLAVASAHNFLGHRAALELGVPYNVFYLQNLTKIGIYNRRLVIKKAMTQQHLFGPTQLWHLCLSSCDVNMLSRMYLYIHLTLKQEHSITKKKNLKNSTANFRIC